MSTETMKKLYVVVRYGVNFLGGPGGLGAMDIYTFLAPAKKAVAKHLQETDNRTEELVWEEEVAEDTVFGTVRMFEPTKQGIGSYWRIFEVEQK